MHRTRHPVTVLLVSWALSSPDAPGQDSPRPDVIPQGYRVETIETPRDEQGQPIQFGVGGIDFALDGTAFVAARVAGIWKYRGGEWSRFAEGLHDPLGIRVVAADGSAVVVAQKPELTLVRDLDGDGRADLYRTLCDRWRSSGNYCEYVHGPVIDKAGNYFVNLNLADGSRDPIVDRAGGAAMGTTGGYDGWLVMVTPDGGFVPFACGLRSPAGIGINARDEVFFTDNQGGWIPSSTLNLAVRGGFYGYPASMLDLPAYRGGRRPEREEFERLRIPPVAWFPHGELSNSPGNPEFDETEGRFGPFAGQVFIGDQTRSNVFRVALDRVGGEYQGAVFNFVDHLQCGCIRLRFDRAGRLWIGQTGRGWASKGGKPYGLQRITWDGHTVPFEMHSMRLTPRGFAIRFTRPVDPATVRAAGALWFKRWHYHYHGKYGSPKVDLTELRPELLSISADGRTVSVGVELKTGQVYQLLTRGLRSTEGATMSTTTCYYTLNRLTPS